MSEAVEIMVPARGHRLHRRALPAVLAAAIGTVVVADALAAHYHSPHRVAIRLVGMAAFSVGVLFLQRAETVRVRATKDVLEVGTRRALRSEIDSASLVTAGDKTVLRFVGPGIDLDVDEATGRKLLLVLGLDAGHRVAKYAVPGRLAAVHPLLSNTQSYGAITLAWMIPVMAAWKKFDLISQNVAWALIAAGAVFMAVLIAPSSLEVGADGFFVRWLGTKRFVAYADVVGVTEATQFGMASLTFALRDGRSVRVVSGKTQGDPVLARLREAMKVETTVGPENQALLLERGSLTARAWLDHLRAIGDGAAATLRVADVDVDALWRVVDDPKAKTSSRIAAAVALNGRGGEGVAERLRAATESSTAPSLRVAIEATTKGDDARLLEAIEEEIAAEEAQERA